MRRILGTLFCALLLMGSSMGVAPATPLDDFRNYVNTNIVSNGQGLIKGSTLNSAFSYLYPVFTSMGAWSPSGSFKLNASTLPAPTTSSPGGIYAGLAPSHQVMVGIAATGIPLFTQLAYGDIIGLGSSATKNTGNSVQDPGTGGLESLFQIQTFLGASKTYSCSDMFLETRRSNGGSAMADVFPAATIGCVVNGTRLTVTNTDATASDVITAGSGTTINGGLSTDTVGPGRAIQYAYDAANTTWRRTLNTATALLGPNNLSDVSNPVTALANLGGLPQTATGTSGHAIPYLDGNNTFSGTETFTGSPIAPTPPVGDNTTKVPTTAFVQAQIAASAAAGTAGNTIGSVNKFRNVQGQIWQRGTSITDSTASTCSSSHANCMTADGWAVLVTGANTTATRGASLGGGTSNSIQVTGAASNTDVSFAQRIESYDAAPLAGAQVTVQFRFKQTTGASVTPKVSTCYASAQDAFGTCPSDLAATSLTSCPTGTTCVEAYTFTPSANAANGYQVSFDCGPLLASQTCAISAMDIRVTPSAAPGINSAPPTPEFRTVQAEQSICERYYEVQTDAVVYQAGYSGGAATNLGAGYVSFHTQKRAIPIMAASNVTYNNSSTFSFQYASVHGFSTGLNITAAGTWFVQYNWTASAEL